MVFAGAENIISPLGVNAAANFHKISNGESGINEIAGIGVKGENIWAASIEGFESFSIYDGIKESILDSLEAVDDSKVKGERTLVILSTTKGDIIQLKNGDTSQANLTNLADYVRSEIKGLPNVQILSNACISGVLGLVVGHDLIEAGEYDHVIVCGADVLSEFTIAGFQSFFAISDDLCKPFDKNRKGINLGEAIGTIILSKDESIFLNKPMKLLGGSEANDANHISGPSRTGEGLYRSIQKTFKYTGITPDQIDFLSAHGTGTAYNDEMESIAFDRAGLINVPLNSLKGFFGHTFGAAGIIETAICMQSMRNNLMVASHGFEETGTTREINVLAENETKELNTVLKTASGFGGCNASIILRK